MKPMQFTKSLPRRGEPFKMRPRIETPTTDSPVEELLEALATILAEHLTTPLCAPGGKR